MLVVEQVAGTGTPLYLLPGLGCSPSVYHDMLPHLTDDFAVHLLTLAGFGGTKADTDARVLDAIEVLGTLRGGILVGHSLSGYLALAAAQTYPDAFRGIVIIDAAPRSPALRETYSATTRELGEKFFPNGKLDRDVAAKWIGEMVMSPEHAANILDDWTHADPRVLLEMFFDVRMLSLEIEPARIRIPIHVIVPFESDDRERELAAFREAYAGAPHVTFDAIGPARHFVMLDQPAATAEAIRRFIQM